MPDAAALQATYQQIADFLHGGEHADDASQWEFRTLTSLSEAIPVQLGNVALDNANDMKTDSEARAAVNDAWCKIAESLVQYAPSSDTRTD